MKKLLLVIMALASMSIFAKHDLNFWKSALQTKGISIAKDYYFDEKFIIMGSPEYIDSSNIQYNNSIVCVYLEDESIGIYKSSKSFFHKDKNIVEINNDYDYLHSSLFEVVSTTNSKMINKIDKKYPQKGEQWVNEVSKYLKITYSENYFYRPFCSIVLDFNNNKATITKAFRSDTNYTKGDYYTFLKFHKINVDGVTFEYKNSENSLYVVSGDKRQKDSLLIFNKSHVFIIPKHGNEYYLYETKSIIFDTLKKVLLLSDFTKKTFSLNYSFTIDIFSSNNFLDYYIQENREKQFIYFKQKRTITK